MRLRKGTPEGRSFSDLGSRCSDGAKVTAKLVGTFIEDQCINPTFITEQ